MAFSKFLDPKNDVAFWCIFGTEKNKDIEFLSTIMDVEIASKKQNIVDVLCRDENGVQVIVKMQVAKTKGFEKRAQLHAAKAYSRQSNNYIDLKKVFFIAISNSALFPEKVEYISAHSIRDIKTNGYYLKDFQFVFIELPKFTKSKVEQLESTIERWYFFLSMQRTLLMKT